MCEVMRSAAESLVYDGKLRDDVDFNTIALGLKQYIYGGEYQLVYYFPW